MKRLIVSGLEDLCTLLDRCRIPHGGCRLASLSYRLDERWQTGAWR